MHNRITVLGAGLAGSEAAWQIAERGVEVDLIEMKPEKMSPAHHSGNFAELVCSNSLRADRIQNAVGLLKEEMRRMNSLVMKAADLHRVPAGGALAVDREGFSAQITETLRQHKNITVIEEEATEIPPSALQGEQIVVVATGPLSSEAMSDSIAKLLGKDMLSFFDAAAPIVTRESLDEEHIFAASRYGKGGDDYLNAPLNEDEYHAFVAALASAEEAELYGFEDKKVFEGCMPVEVMARRGEMTLAFGPMKPVGLTDPRTGKRPFAVLQLRREDAAGNLYNLVGCQTHLRFPEQKRVFALIPALQEAEFARYGVMHRNTFLQSPGILGPNYQCLAYPTLFFAGQMTGVEGYVESASSGLVAGISAVKTLLGKSMPQFSPQTAHGALCRHVSAYAGSDYQPMNVSFGLIDPLDQKIRNKQERYTAIAERALEDIDAMQEEIQ